MEIIIISIVILCAIIYYVFGTFSPKKIVDTFDSRNPYDNTVAPIYAANRSFVLYDKDWQWTKFIYKNLDKLYPIESYSVWNLDKKYPTYFKIEGYNNYVIVFSYSWMWHIYQGQSAEGIRNSFDLGGQSNRADYLTSQQLRVGIQIQRWYINYLRNQGYDVFLDASGREQITKMKVVTI